MSTKEPTRTDELLHAWIDGELDAAGADELLARLRSDRSQLTELEALERLAQDAASLPAPALPAGFVARTMERLHETPAPRRTLANLALSRRLQVRLSLVHVALGLAVTLGIALAAGSFGFQSGRSDAAAEIAAAPVGEAQLVRFVLRAEDAASVELAGDFNGWTPAPLARRPDGTFEALLPLGRGRHEYAFRVDGSWQPDPQALQAVDDGFGGRNSVIEVL